jgi:hypothetical protein
MHKHFLHGRSELQTSDMAATAHSALLPGLPSLVHHLHIENAVTAWQTFSVLHTLMVTAAAGLCFLQNVSVPVNDYNNRRGMLRASNASYAVTQVKWSIHLREVQPLQCCLYVRVILHNVQV